MNSIKCELRPKWLNYFFEFDDRAVGQDIPPVSALTAHKRRIFSFYSTAVIVPLTAFNVLKVAGTVEASQVRYALAIVALLVSATFIWDRVCRRRICQAEGCNDEG